MGTARRTRESYIPADSTAEPDPHSDAVVYRYTTGAGRIAAVAFTGRSAKPRWHYAFSSEDDLRREIDRLYAERRPVVQARAARARPHTLAVGDILDCSWGYEQTNVDFYQVTRALPAYVEVRRIAASRIEEQVGMFGTCTPIRDRFIGEAKRYRADGENSVTIGGYRASPWNGSPRHWSSYA